MGKSSEVFELTMKRRTLHTTQNFAYSTTTRWSCGQYTGKKEMLAVVRVNVLGDSFYCVPFMERTVAWREDMECSSNGGTMSNSTGKNRCSSS